MSDNLIPAGLDAAIEHTKLPEEVYSTCDALEIITDNRPQPEEIWGGLDLVPGQLMEIIGPSGIGKSRIMLNLAINQILGRPFAGMKTLQKPLTWLFHGNENSFFRFRKDLQRMTSILSTEERERLRGHIYLPTMEKATDALISFSDPTNIERLMATIRQRQPDVLVLDPWGAIISGDELNDEHVRATLITIVKVLGTIPDKPMVAIILNHSRNGPKEIIEASGMNKANYGKNSKAIYSVVRNVWNLRPAEFSDHPKKIELIHAKSSDHQEYSSVAIDFNFNTFHYQHDTTFQHAVWQAALEKHYHYTRTTLSDNEQSAARRNEVTNRLDDIVKYVTANGPMSKAALEDWAINHQGWPTKPARQLIQDVVDKGRLSFVIEHVTSKKILGTAEQLMDLRNNAASGTYR